MYRCFHELDLDARMTNMGALIVQGPLLRQADRTYHMAFLLLHYQPIVDHLCLSLKISKVFYNAPMAWFKNSISFFRCRIYNF